MQEMECRAEKTYRSEPTSGEEHCLQMAGYNVSGGRNPFKANVWRASRRVTAMPSNLSSKESRRGLEPTISHLSPILICRLPL